MRDLILTLFIFAMLPLCFARPQVGVLLWACIGYLSPHRLTWSYAYNFRFVYFVALVTLLGLYFAQDIRKRIPINAVTLMWILLVFWMCLTTYFSLNGKWAAWEWQRSMKIHLMVAASLLVIHGRQWLHWSAWMVVGSIGFWGMKGGLFTLLTGGNYRVYGPEGSFITDNNTFCLALITTFPLIRYLQLQTGSKLVRLGLWVLMGAFALAIVGTYSRGGFIGAGILLIYFWFKSPKRWWLGLIMLVSLPAIYQFMPIHWKDRIMSIQQYEQDKSAINRMNSWRFAYNLARDRPILGGGFQSFNHTNFQRYAPVPEEVHDAHSIFFEVMAEQGFAGLGIFIIFFLLVFHEGRRVTKLCKPWPELHWARDYASMLQVGLLGYASSGAFLGLAYFDLPYHMVALLVNLRLVVDEEIRKAEQQPVAKRPPVRSIFGGGRRLEPQRI